MVSRYGRKTSYRGIQSMGGGRYKIRIKLRIAGEIKTKEHTINAESVQAASLVRSRLIFELNGKPKPQSVSERLDIWFKAKQSYITPATTKRYLSTINVHLKPAFGNEIDLTAERVLVWAREAAKELEPITINSMLDVLQNALPDLKIKKLQTRRKKKRAALTVLEAKDFLQKVKEHYPQHYAMVLLIFSTGLRMGSVLALRWEDLEDGVLHLRNRISAGKLIAGGTKTGDLSIALPTALLDVLRDHQKQQMSSPPFMFVGKDGKLHSRSALKKPFTRIVKLLGWSKQISPHGARRTVSDALRQNGIDLMVRKAIVGHSTDQMVEHYSTISATEQRTAIESVMYSFLGGLAF